MAYMNDGKGPYPNKRGEHCGNFRPGTIATPIMMESQQEANSRQQDWLAKMRFGRPGNCKAGSSKEMASKGWVGLYLKANRKLFYWETPVITDELSEEFVSSPNSLTKKEEEE